MEKYMFKLFITFLFINSFAIAQKSSPYICQLKTPYITSVTQIANNCYLHIGESFSDMNYEWGYNKFFSWTDSNEALFINQPNHQPSLHFDLSHFDPGIYYVAVRSKDRHGLNSQWSHTVMCRKM